MADNLVYEESLNTEIETSEFISKKWVYVNDNNSQNYTSQIVIDSTPLSNAGGYINWQEGFIVMPLVVVLSSTTVANLPVNTNKGNFAWAFKSGFWQLINSMTVEFNNQNVIQQTPFLNVFRSFKANTSFSLDDVFNVGPTTGFCPDSAGSWDYADVLNNANQTSYQGNCSNYPYTNNTNTQYYASAPTFINGNNFVPYAQGNANLNAQVFLPFTGVAGQPIVNSTADPSVISYSGVGSANGTTGNPNSFNEGMLKRQSWYNYAPNTTANGFNNAGGQATINNGTNCGAVYRSYLDIDQSPAGSLTWQVYAKLRLKDLADFFEKMPLLKGSTIRFYINTNQANVNFTTVAQAVTSATGVLATQQQLTINNGGPTVVGGLTFPLMIASCKTGNGGQALTAGTYNLSVSIYKNNFTGQVNGQHTALNSCRLYAPVYYMNPLAESKYLSLAPTKKIMYKDVFQYQFNGQSAGSNFNILVSNGISNIQSVLVVPFISKTNNFTDSGGNLIALPYSTYLSPVSPTPAMPDPITLSNFNILVSGVNLFLNNEYYDYEAFLEQLAQSNQINGGLTTGLASGLINEDMFSKGYRYYYGDASRILPSEQGVSRSVQVVGQVQSSVAVDLMVFVEFMREITIDISTGARIE